MCNALLLQGNDAVEPSVDTSPNPVMELPQPLNLPCSLYAPKAWVNKWSSTFLRVGGGQACWAASAAHAAVLMLAFPSGAKGAPCVSVASCVAEAVAGKVDGKQNIVRLKLADKTEVTAHWQTRFAC